MKNTFVFRDKRGWIKKFNIKGVSFNILYTKKGAMRSGDYHKTAQYDLILSGRWRITMRKRKKDISIIRGPNTVVKIPPKIPHLYKALSDSIMIEWWDGPFEAKYFWPYRKMIEESLKVKRKKRNR